MNAYPRIVLALLSLALATCPALAIDIVVSSISYSRAWAIDNGVESETVLRFGDSAWPQPIAALQGGATVTADAWIQNLSDEATITLDTAHQVLTTAYYRRSLGSVVVRFILGQPVDYTISASLGATLLTPDGRLELTRYAWLGRLRPCGGWETVEESDVNPLVTMPTFHDAIVPMSGTLEPGEYIVSLYSALGSFVDGTARGHFSLELKALPEPGADVPEGASTLALLLLSSPFLLQAARRRPSRPSKPLGT